MGGNTLFSQILQPETLFLGKDKGGVLNPLGQIIYQGFSNAYDLVRGETKFGQHKNWVGGSDKNWANEYMREWTEGKYYKQWDDYNAQESNRRKHGATIPDQYKIDTVDTSPKGSYVETPYAMQGPTPTASTMTDQPAKQAKTNEYFAEDYAAPPKKKNKNVQSNTSSSLIWEQEEQPRSLLN